MEKTIKLLKEAGLEIRDSQLFIQALTHRSYIHENSGSNSNERLEFLGDAVLGLVMGELLYERFPTGPEGTLSRVRSSLVREDTLAEVALSLHIGASLRLGKGEEYSPRLRTQITMTKKIFRKSAPVEAMRSVIISPPQ